MPDHVFARTPAGFKKARDAARQLATRLKLTSAAAYKKLGAKRLGVHGLPSNPDRVWQAEWQGWADWLGNCDRAQNLTSGLWFLSFKAARRLARACPATSIRTWKTWVRGEREAGRCTDVPVNPDLVYEDWNGWEDWLGA